jgi:iron complex outermembrane receptor protein
MAYGHGRYTSFPNAPNFVPSPAGGNILETFNAAGMPTSHLPDFQGSVTFGYSIPLSDGKIEPSITESYNSGYCWMPDCHVRQPAYNLVNSSLGWSSTDDHWGVKLWINNMFGREYYRWGEETAAAYVYIPAAPRTYGITFRVKF